MGIMDWLGHRAEAANIGYAQKYLDKYILLTRNKKHMNEVAQWMGSDGFALINQLPMLNPDALMDASQQITRTADNVIKIDPVSGGVMKLLSHYFFLKVCQLDYAGPNYGNSFEVSGGFVDFFDEVRRHLTVMKTNGEHIDQSGLDAEIDKWMPKS